MVRRVGRSPSQLSEEPWDTRRPTGLSHVRRKWPGLCSPPCSDPRVAAPGGQDLGSAGADCRQLHLPGAERQALRLCTADRTSTPASPSLCRENTGPEVPARVPRLTQLVGARLQSPAEGCRGSSLAVLHLNEALPS